MSERSAACESVAHLSHHGGKLTIDTRIITTGLDSNDDLLALHTARSEAHREIRRLCSILEKDVQNEATSTHDVGSLLGV